MDRLQRAK
jgi:hypothetical protein